MEIKNIACVGAGTIGCGWAAHLLLRGLPVRLYDINGERLAAARENLTKMLENCEAVGVLEKGGAAERLPLAAFSSDLAGVLGDADLVLESVPENLELKRRVLAAIEEHCRMDALIATSTSGLPVSDIAENAQNPGRVVGAHPFNPVYLIPLVEIVKGRATEQACADAVAEFLQSVGKETVVLQKEIPGFIANRLQAAMHREARDLVARGLCSVEDVDKAVVYGPGSRWGIIGPHVIFELNGGAGGLRKQAGQKGDTTAAWYRDMAAWDRIPEGYVDRACTGLEEALRHRSPREGRTHEELARYRDEGLALLLRFHGKL